MNRQLTNNEWQMLESWIGGSISAIIEDFRLGKPHTMQINGILIKVSRCRDIVHIRYNNRIYTCSGANLLDGKWSN